VRTSLTTVDVLIGGESKRRAPRAPGGGAQPHARLAGVAPNPVSLEAVEAARSRWRASGKPQSSPTRRRLPRSCCAGTAAPSGGRQLRALARQADALERQRLVLVKAHRLQLVAEIGRGRHHAASAAGVLLTSDDGAAGSSYCSTSSWLTPLRRRPLAGRGVDREPLRQLLDPEAGAAVEGVAVARQPQRAVGRADL
jgi:hypothetical protein